MCLYSVREWDIEAILSGYHLPQDIRSIGKPYHIKVGQYDANIITQDLMYWIIQKQNKNKYKYLFSNKYLFGRYKLRVDLYRGDNVDPKCTGTVVID